MRNQLEDATRQDRLAQIEASLSRLELSKHNSSYVTPPSTPPRRCYAYTQITQSQQQNPLCSKKDHSSIALPNEHPPRVSRGYSKPGREVTLSKIYEHSTLISFLAACLVIVYILLAGVFDTCQDQSQSSPQVCWASRTFGPALSEISNVEYVLTPSMCEASQTIWGGEGMNLERAADKLLNCNDSNGLLVYVIGGSITCGASKHRETRIDSPCSGAAHGVPCPEEAWPKYLEDVLNAYHNCGNQVRHTIISECQGGIGSDYWVDKFATYRWDKTHPLNNADIVLIETAANDGWMESPLDAEINTELLSRMVRSLPTRPWTMWVTASWHSGLWNRTDPDVYKRQLGYHRDAEQEQIRVLRYYGISHVSMLQAFQPLAGSTPRHDFFENIYKTDTVHPSRLGHRMIASVVARRIAKQLHFSADRSSWLNEHPATNYSFPRRIVPEATYMTKVIDKLQSAPISLDLTKVYPDGVNAVSTDTLTTAKVLQLSGFTRFEDVPGKPGLIGMNVGASFTISIPDLKSGLVRIGVLKSYERMGRFTASLIVPHHTGLNHTTPPKYCATIVNSGLPTEHDVILLNQTVDTLWQHRVSVMSSIYLNVPRPQMKTTGLWCGWLRVTIEKATPLRQENKIKALHVTVL